MTAAELARLHAQLDDLQEGLAALKTSVEVSIATCDICRLVVMGNSERQSVDARLSNLETLSGLRLKGLWLALSCGSAVISGVAVVLCMKLLGGLLSWL